MKFGELFAEIMRHGDLDRVPVAHWNLRDETRELRRPGEPC